MARKGSTTTTQQTTQQVYTDQSASAAEGSIAVGAGANVNIESLDAEVAKTAIAGQVEAGRTVGAVAVEALETTGETAGLAIAGQLAATREVADVAGTSIAAQNVLARSALETTRDVSGMAIGAQERTAQTSIAAQNVLARSAIDTTGRLAEHTINTAAGIAESSARETADVLSTSRLQVESQQGLANKLASLAEGALERGQTPDSQITKTLLWVVGAIAAFVALAFMSGKRRAAA